MNDQERRFANPRVAAGVVFRDGASRILMIRPTYKSYWDLPGGYVEVGESPRTAAAREVHEELGVAVELGPLLAVDWAPSDAEGDKLLFLFDGPALPRLDSLRLAANEVAEIRYVDFDQLDEVTIARLARRIRSAVTGAGPYLEHGTPAFA
jgi:8-oxo-dGTP diphosphatase